MAFRPTTKYIEKCSENPVLVRWNFVNLRDYVVDGTRNDDFSAHTSGLFVNVLFRLKPVNDRDGSEFALNQQTLSLLPPRSCLIIVPLLPVLGRSPCEIFISF